MAVIHQTHTRQEGGPLGGEAAEHQILTLTTKDEHQHGMLLLEHLIPTLRVAKPQHGTLLLERLTRMLM